MVYKHPARLKSPIRGPCEQIHSKKRPLCIGANIEQKPWKPTLRRVAAENLVGKPSYKTIPPYLGPNVVDSNKKSAPAYSLGKGVPRKATVAEEGPAKFNISGLCNKGLQTAPAYSLKSRRPELKKFQSPAANKYSLEKSLKATSKTIPKFSFGKKPVVLKSIALPAPNVYHLPPIFGTAKEGHIKAAPAYSMLGRPKPRERPGFVLPGPSDYENNYRFIQKISPRFSIHKKHKIISDEHMKPGPAAHCPEKFFKHKSVPAPSFSIQYTPHLGLRKAYLMQECKSAKPEWIL